MSLIAEYYRTFWALDPTVFHAMDMIVSRWASGVRLSPEEIQAAIGDAPERVQARREAAIELGTFKTHKGGGIPDVRSERSSSGQPSGGVAVLPVYGVLTHRGYQAQSVSTSLTSTEVLATQLRSLVRDPGVAAVVMDFDSPGGSVHGVQELGETIQSLRGEKPIVGVANATAASGAYWAISQCDEIVVTPSGWVGSIGVIMAHDDLSVAMEKAGIKREYITSGEHKAEGNPTGPLTASTRGHLQGLSDTYYGAFTKAVAKGRKVGVDVVRSEAWGRGRMVLASAAVESGMADRIDTLENTIARLGKPQGRRSAMSAASASAHIQALVASNPIDA